jgi:gluconolactonase
MVSCSSDERPEAEVPSIEYATIGSIERLDPALDAIVPPGAVLEILAEGHEWTEGPVWVPAMDAILYSDIPNNAIYRWSEGSGATLWLQPAGVHRRGPARRREWLQWPAHRRTRQAGTGPAR